MFVVTAVLSLLALSIATCAAITIDTVTVGDPENEADPLTGYGSVPYTYKIDKYEVTAGEYCAFLNAVAKDDTHGLYNLDMWSSNYGCKIQQIGDAGNYSYSIALGWENRPVNYVSYWDACRFANWLHNGQPTGEQDETTTEDGAYTLNDYTDSDGRDIQRNTDWKWAVTNENEWYKAAYYKGGIDAGYWLFPTQSNTPPSNQLIDPDPGNNATYYDNGYTIGNPYYRTEAGAHENSESAYGTFDQGGNVTEWNEAVIYIGEDVAARGRRGGSYGGSVDFLRSSFRAVDNPTYEDYYVGFRVTQPVFPYAVPEFPAALLATLGGLSGVVWLRLRKS